MVPVVMDVVGKNFPGSLHYSCDLLINPLVRESREIPQKWHRAVGAHNHQLPVVARSKCLSVGPRQLNLNQYKHQPIMRKAEAHMRWLA